MEDLNDKSNGDSVSATQWNGTRSEVQNVIEDFGIALSGADLDQLGKAIANYVAAGDFYTDTGAADAYVLTKIGDKQQPTTLAVVTNGLRARFRPANASTGASTVNVAGLGVKTLLQEDGTAIIAGDLATNKDAEIRYNQATDEFFLIGA